LIALTLIFLSLTAAARESDIIGYVNYGIDLPIADRIYIEAFDDPKVKNVVCYVSRALKGGISGMLRFVSEPARVSISCQKTGPISWAGAINITERGETVFSQLENWPFKRLYVTRFVDRKRRVLVYLTWTSGPLEGQPFNAINTIPID